MTGWWFRAIHLQYLPTRLATDHTRTRRSRFSSASPDSPKFRILYLGQNHQVALHEVDALLGDPASPTPNASGLVVPSWAILGLDVTLDHVVDLTDPAQQEVIETNLSELTGKWERSDLAPTQQLGEALYSIRKVEGVIYPSSRVDARCLAVFPDKLSRRSRIAFRNEMRNPPGVELLT